MKTTCFLLLTIILFSSCGKNSSSKETIGQDDVSATTGMTNEQLSMRQAVTNLAVAQSSGQRHHWDSIYHHHDSLFWHHHNNYHHNTYTHDDHSHQWVPYDPAINHSHHYHHPYPGHLNDSLITVLNNHHHTNCEHHPGHHICHHHTMDSLHHVHNLHHP